jgi:hypothetical protein
MKSRARIKKRAVDELSIEGSDFVARIMDLSQIWPSELHGLDFETLQKDHSGRVYVAEIHNRLVPLMDRVLSLNQIFDLLEQKKLPIKIGQRNFSRYDWVRLTLDILQVRFTSVRDSALLVAAAVFEVHQDPRTIKVSKLRAIRGAVKIADSLERIGSVGPAIRNARDRNFHRAEDPVPFDDPALFQFLAKLETSNRWVTPKLTSNLDSIHKKVMTAIRTDFDREAPKLVKELHRLLDRLHLVFEKRFHPKFLSEKEIY